MFLIQNARRRCLTRSCGYMYCQAAVAVILQLVMLRLPRFENMAGMNRYLFHLNERLVFRERQPLSHCTLSWTRDRETYRERHRETETYFNKSEIRCVDKTSRKTENKKRKASTRSVRPPSNVSLLCSFHHTANATKTTRKRYPRFTEAQVSVRVRTTAAQVSGRIRRPP